METNRAHLDRRQFVKSLAAAGAGLTIGGPATALAQETNPPRRSNIKLGLDNFAVRAMKWKAGQLIDYAASLRTDSLFISDLAPFDSFEDNYLKELKAKAAKADEFWDRLLRLTADLENYKKRAARERQEAVRYANESLLERLIPVLDNFDMAVAAANNPQNSSVESIRTGIAMISSQLRSAMADAGLEEIDAANKPFDANWHEAVSQQESAEAPEGHVLQQLRKGYKLRERLLRPATVVIAKKPAA